jgi:ribonucleoside-triphosphate reductase
MLKEVTASPASVEQDTRSLISDAKFYESYSRWLDNEQRYETWEEAVERVMNMHRMFYADKMSDELAALIDEAEEAYKNKKVLGAQRALQFGGDQILKHQMRMYNCFAEETSFVTTTGVQSFSDFEDGDTVQVLTHKGNVRNATVRNYGKQKLNKVRIGKNESFKEYFVTANHRWILENGETTENLQVGDSLWKEYSQPSFDWDSATIEEKLYWCYGMVYGDGTVNNDYGIIRLCGKDSRFLDRFRYFGFKTSSSLSIEGDIMVFIGGYKKTLPDPEIDSPELINAFIHGYLAADGTKGKEYWSGNKSSFTQIYAKDEEAQRFIEKVFPAHGFHIGNKTQNFRQTNFGVKDGFLYTFVSTKNSPYSKKTKVLSIEESDRFEDVWCLEVEEDRSFILEGGIFTGNCTSSYADRAAFFQEIFYILLCGAGTGFSVQYHHVNKLPEIAERKKQAKVFVPEDSIEGWADCLGVLMSSYFADGGTFPEYVGRRVFFDLSNIRAKGTPISGGFKAPGPEPLRKALDKIEYLLQGLALKGVKRLRPIHVYDIVMYAADAVLAGGVRRSATICLFSPEDEEMMKAKTGNWFPENPQRGRSNNSAVIVRDEVTKEQFDGFMGSIKQFGEPGFFFVDDKDFTTNPCVEIGMYPQIDGVSGWQGCNLTEINGSAAKTPEEFYAACRAGAILGTLQAGYTDFKYIGEASKKIFDREALLGVSVTGWMGNPDILLDVKVQRKGAKTVLKVNEEVAGLIGINPAARTTCVKPSGNASVLLMTPSGIHGEHSPRYFRIAQINKESEIARILAEKVPYMVEESIWSENNTDYSVAFPVISDEGSIYKDELNGINLLEKVKMVQQNWVEYGTRKEACTDERLRHNVSNTVTVTPTDWSRVTDFVFDNRKFFAGISFLGASGDKDYNQAPFTRVLTEDEIVSRYGRASMFASGLIIESFSAFPDLWVATSTAQQDEEDRPLGEQHDRAAEWIRRFHKFADNYFGGDQKMAEYCLKDVHLLHRWTKIQQNMIEIDFTERMTTRKYIDIDTMGSIACAGQACEVSF